ncbi:arabinose efflux permease family protein [Thermoplasmatales archaeon SCGC AB-539-N05]|nr:arabinose efflux permease family protein [Thermoplasmatales archaeon SCGC AB-539-N05]
MLDLNQHPSLKYILFGDIYFANGIQGAIGIMLLIVYFTEKDISIATATMVAGVASIPFAFKFLFGPLTDRFIKKGRKPFIIIGGLIGGLALIPLAFIDPTISLLPFTLSLFIAVIGIVILDVAADAWAIQVTKVHEHGKINAAMFGSMFGGVAVGVIFLSQIAKYYSYNLVFIIGGFIIFLTMILPLIVKEEIIVKKRPKIGKLLIQEFKKKNTIIISLFGFLAAMNFGILLFIIPEYMMNVLELDVAQIGLMTSLFPIGVIIGAVTGGLIADRWGRKKTLAIFLFGSIIVSSLLITADTWMILAIIYPIIGFLQGGSTFSALMALFMDITNPKIGGTQFSILTSIANLGDYSIAIVSGSLLMILGYQRFFLYAAWIVGPALLVLYLVKEKWEKNC